MNILDYALLYYDASIAVIPILPDGSKRPACRWAQYRREPPTRDTVVQWYSNGRRYGIAAICGIASRGLEVIDVDCERLQQPVLDYLLQHDLLTDVAVVRTPREGSGLQIWYRCSEVGPNQKLAYDTDGNALIETRGEGGYALAIGGAPEAHPTGRPYELREGVSPWRIGRITPEQRGALIDFCAGLSEQEIVALPPDDFDPLFDGDMTKPGNDFGAKVSWEEILEPHGWKIDSTGRVKCKWTGQMQTVTNWTRPGKEEGTSATTGLVTKHGNEVFYVFSSSTDLPTHKPLTKFAAYALMSHEGDFQAATRTLREQGYGATLTPEDVFTALPEDTEPDEPVKAQVPFPPSLMEVPGFLGELSAYTNQTAYLHQPVFSLSGAIAALSTLMGTAYSVEGTKANVYVVNIADTGRGKNRCLVVNAELFTEAGFPQHIVDEDFHSATGVAQALRAAQGQGLLQIDEFGTILAALKSDARDVNALRLRKFLLKWFSTPGGRYATNYARADRNFVIDRLYFSLLGCTTPGTLDEALEQAEISNGLLPRILIFQGDPKPDENENRSFDPMPEALIERAKAIKVVGEFGAVREAKKTKGGEHKLQEFRSQVREKVFESDNELEAHWWTRAVELANKLALIYAVSADHEEVVISADAASWATRVVSWCIVSAHGVAGEITESMFHAQQLKVLKAIPRAWITLTELTRRTRWLKASERNEVLGLLEVLGEIEKEKKGKEGSYKPVIRVRRR